MCNAFEEFQNACWIPRFSSQRASNTSTVDCGCMRVEHAISCARRLDLEPRSACRQTQRALGEIDRAECDGQLPSAMIANSFTFRDRTTLMRAGYVLTQLERRCRREKTELLGAGDQGIFVGKIALSWRSSDLSSHFQRQKFQTVLRHLHADFRKSCNTTSEP
jgi:hypothetical protein